jgi:hypothetical protein
MLFLVVMLLLVWLLVSIIRKDKSLAEKALDEASDIDEVLSAVKIKSKTVDRVNEIKSAVKDINSRI